jgi:predicted HicB family RNase H-like nuclease
VTKKRFVIEVDDKFHEEIKKRAEDKQITLRKWILRAILQQIKIEEKYE